MTRRPRTPPVLIHRVVTDDGLMHGGTLRRVHALTTDGRTFQHRRCFARDEARLSTFIADVEVRLENAGHRLSSLNPRFWEDVTDDVFHLAMQDLLANGNG